MHVIGELFEGAKYHTVLVLENRTDFGSCWKPHQQRPGYPSAKIAIGGTDVYVPPLYREHETEPACKKGLHRFERC